MEGVVAGGLKLQSDGNTDSTTMVNGTNTLSPPPAGFAVGFRHNLPQIPTMTRTKIAQSKASIKKSVPQNMETATLHIEGTSKIVKLTSDEEHKEKIVEVEEVPLDPEKDEPQTKKASGNKKKLAKEAAEENVGENNVTKCRKENKKCKPGTVEKMKQVVAAQTPDKPEKKNRRMSRSQTESENKGNEPAKKTENLPVDNSNKQAISETDRNEPEPVPQEMPSPANALTKTPQSGSKRGRRSNANYEVTTSPVETKDESKRQRKPKSHYDDVEAQPKKPKTEKESPKQLVLHGDEKPAKWLIGDLLWAKVSGHPFWPCMVAYDPFQGLYTRLLCKFNVLLIYNNWSIL